jgi:hypothetical protein
VRTFVAAYIAALCFCGNAFGQVYNPYAKTQDDPLPVTKDGKLNWPAFFKSKALEDRFQAYFAMGSCVGTKQEINTMLRDNKVDVNQLPELAVRGLAIGCNSAAATITDDRGTNTILVTHPAGVTKVTVTGEMPVSQLKPDMVVRFLGRVDQRGAGTDPIDAIEVITPDPHFRWLPVEAKRVQTITGIVTRFQGQRLQVRVDAGKMHRLSFNIADQAKVNVDGASLSLVAPGDEITATGRAYKGPGAAGMGVIFASEVTVTKAMSAAKGTPSAKTTDVASASDN